MQGFRPIYKTPAYEVLIDEDGFGLEIHEYRTPGLATPYVIATVPIVRWDQFSWRSDWPKGTRVLCTDVGQDGSYWRFNGTRWILDREFDFVRSQGGIAGQALRFSNTLNGFRAFGSFTTPRAFFASTGRRFRVQARVLKGAGVQNAPSTQVTLDTVPLYSFPWNVAGATKEQVIDVVLTLPDDSNIAAGALQRAVTSSNLATPNTGSPTVPVSTDTAAFPTTLENIVHTFAIGVTDTGTNGATYGLLDLRFACLA